METSELRKKVIAFVNEADEEMLLVIENVFEKCEDSNDYELPEIAERLIFQAMDESNQGLVRSHGEVMAEFKKKNN